MKSCRMYWWSTTVLIGEQLAQETQLFASDGLDGVTVIDLPDEWGDLEEDNVLRVLFSQTTVEEGPNVPETHEEGTVELFSTTIAIRTSSRMHLRCEKPLAIAQRLASAPDEVEDAESRTGRFLCRAQEVQRTAGIAGYRRYTSH